MKELKLTLSHIQKSYTRPVLTDVNLEVTNDSCDRRGQIRLG